MTHVRVWKFRPPDGREDEFAAAYGAESVWAALFRRADGYYGTRLLRPEGEGGWWMTLDHWRSEADFDAFQRQFGDEYRKLDRELEGLSGDEEFVGTFEED
ncbi:antibiotic biosynthesis monooxygenase family protein [Sphingomonas hankyongi]|uniref:Antibiotic biosynthesis monooxygenase n=1 Tax=Sphingomonas hankyongi TaxID=2908209 RepID=A0ABT0RYV6_9SPHN|nr:antibiotic biosynthesis monooxygenase [Sphingomonas hankyongi]MCL6728742.1 antibiotic biosynthesis monooxygenase [Sphingomonas hankyongi]